MNDQVDRPLTPDEEWIANFYRVSELSGSLFFGGLARAVPAGPIMADLTRHYADEAQHARLWTDCLGSLGCTPQKLNRAYQDGYLASAGVPANMTDILAVTYVFEHRVINQYGRHLHAPDVHPAMRGTIKRILRDEGWHVHWVGTELGRIAERRGSDHVEAALARYRAADEEVFAAAVKAFSGHLDFPGSPLSGSPILTGDARDAVDN